ncbi:MAG: chorismate mutase [Gemmatimonadales bacterium]
MIPRSLFRWFAVPSIRGIRGAITVDANTAAAICDAAVELVRALETANAIGPRHLVSAVFTMTPDLTAGFPAEAARRAGWDRVPLLCATEIAVPGALPRCLRVLVHVSRRWTADPTAVYLRGAAVLRPDLSALPTVKVMPRIVTTTPAASTR